MKQLEIEYFWPLTEQIPLDLDYTDCEKPKLSTLLTYNTSVNIGNWSTTSIIANNLTIDVASTTFKVDKEPNIIRKGLLNILGIKWEKK